MTERPEQPPRGTFTGRHMAAILIGGFGVVVAVNLLMANLATSTFGGVVVDNSYVASQKFNGWLDRARQSDSLGWDVKLARDARGRVLVETSKVPAGAAIEGEARHPLGRLPDSALAFVPAGDGRYVSTAPVPEGRWVVRLKVAAGSDVWRGERALP